MLSIDSGVDVSLQESIQAALFARVQDTNTEVLDALYSNPNVILPILQKHTAAYLSHLSNTLNAPGSKPKKLFLRAHLTFLSAHFCRQIGPAALGQVFDKVFFPLLLFSKPKQRTAEIVWEIIAQGHGVGDYELLNGCVDIWNIEKSKDVADSVDKMTAMNLALSSKMAGAFKVCLWLFTIGLLNFDTDFLPARKHSHFEQLYGSSEIFTCCIARCQPTCPCTRVLDRP